MSAPAPSSTATASGSIGAPAAPAGRWGILLTLFLARIAMGYQFQSIASVSGPLQEAFDISHAAVGTLVGLYLLPGILIAIPGGILGGRLGDRRAILLGLGLMAAGGVLGGFATDHALLISGRLLAGVGVIFLFIMIPKTVSEWFTGGQLFFAMSLYLGGWPVGMAVGLVVHPAIAAEWHWSAVFLSTGGLCAAIFLVCLAFLRNPPRPVELEVPSVGRALRLPWRLIVTVSLIAILWTVINASHTIVIAFGPRLIEAMGYNSADAGAYVSINLWVGIVTMPIGGWLASRFGRPNLFVLISALVGGSAVLMIALMPGQFVLWFVLIGIFFLISAGVIVALPMEVLSRRDRPAGLGVFYTWWYAGMAGLPAVGGWTRDVSGDPGAPIVFAALLAMSAALFLVLFRLMQRRFVTKVT